MDKKIRIARPPVGVKFFEPGQKKDLEAAGAAYHGPSYCDALRRATQGETVLLRPGSIEVCRWSPPVLGLKRPESDFEKDREPRMPRPASGILIARLDGWPQNSGDPQVVVLRADREAFMDLAAIMKPEDLYDEHTGVDRTMIPMLVGQKGHPLKAAMLKLTNRILEWLGRFDFWTNLTFWMFRREWTSRMLNFVLDRTMANMSMCRNSTVIPLISGKVNASHFCTGGISWGKNPAHLMTCGMPYELYKSADGNLAFDMKG